MFCDAHFHLLPSLEAAELQKQMSQLFVPLIQDGSLYRACTCAHGKDEFFHQSELIADIRRCKNISDKVVLYSSFGLHPQNPLLENIDFLESLLRQNRIDAIGEAGFDLFTPDYKQNIENQKKAWNNEIELAIFYKKPLVVHERKAIDLIFADSRRLKTVPAVVFHSFPGSKVEALSLLKRGINGFFSFGKQVLNNNKKVIDCVSNLPIEHLLLETDAPFQTLKGENCTRPSEIMRVYNETCRLRGIPDDFYEAIEKNFTGVFGEKTVTGC